jgi:OOP family OmpA-OmpF porin
MTTSHALRLLTLAGLAPLLAAPALAQQDGYYYGGLSVGRSRIHVDEGRMTTDLIGSVPGSIAIASDRNDTGYKLFGGYQFNRSFGVELGYFDLGKFGFTSTTTAPNGTVEGQLKVRGINLDLVGAMPLTERFSVLGRIGVTNARTRSSFAGTGAVTVTDTGTSRRDTNLKVGAGLQYAFSPSFIVRGEVERYRINDTLGEHGHVNLMSVSLVFPFGRSPEPMRRAAAPAYVAPPPAPAPVVVQAPPPVVVPAPLVAPVAVAPARRRVTFSAESLFGFDKSTIRPEGKTALDTLAREIEGAQYEVISVEGHTDRIGTEAYNQTLSLERADAVKAYLVSTGKFADSKINAVGKGESSPVTKAGECQGNGQGTALVACLQPDRRVEIEIVGSR